MLTESEEDNKEKQNVTPEESASDQREHDVADEAAGAEQEDTRKWGDNVPAIPEPEPRDPASDPRVQEVVQAIHKAAIDNIRDEEYWDGLIVRAKDLNIIQDPIKREDAENTLFGAVRANNIPKVEELLQAGEDPNQQNANGSYPLHFACIKNFITVAKLLQQHGASVTVSNRAGLTPLHCAVDVGGSLKLCVWLVSHGAEIDVPSATGKTPLHCTCLQGFKEIAQWLLKKGANIHAETTDGSVTAHFACHRGSIELVELLLEKGAKIDVPNTKGETPFMWACDRGHVDLVAFLRDKGVNVAARSNLGHNALHYAALNGHIDVVIYLAQTAGLDVNAPDNEMGTPLHCALQKGHRDCAIWFMENGGIISSVTTSKVSLLHSACDGGDLKLVQLLCDRGLDPAAKDTELRLVEREQSDGFGIYFCYICVLYGYNANALMITG
jgi:ankyrin repeat protein